VGGLKPLAARRIGLGKGKEMGARGISVILFELGLWLTVGHESWVEDSRRSTSVRFFGWWRTFLFAEGILFPLSFLSCAKVKCKPIF
jgi:hypothetical protein